MRFCTECLSVNGHHPNCPEAEDCTEPDEEKQMRCEYCEEHIQEGDQKVVPDDLPDDIPWKDSWDEMWHHRWCFEEVVHEWRQENRP